MRIHITGNAGSGKSTLASTMGLVLGIKVYSLDKIVWKPGWQMTSSNERKEREEQLVLQPQWIIEGVSSIVRKAADIIIYLDFPRRVCYFRCIKRNWRYLFVSRPGLPENCPEIKIVPTLTKIIWNFQNTVGLSIIKDMKIRNKTGIRISSNNEMKYFLTELNRNKCIKLTA
jgi:adenylate kinase family enzyme